MSERETLRIAAVAHVHVKKSSQGTLTGAGMVMLDGDSQEAPDTPLAAEAVA